MAASGAPEASVAPDSPTEPERPLGRSILVGVAVALAVTAIGFFLIAIPFYTLASFEPNGLDRPVVRTGLFRIALPVGALLGVVVGSVSGWWYRRGRGWTTGGDESPYVNH